MLSFAVAFFSPPWSIAQENEKVYVTVVWVHCPPSLTACHAISKESSKEEGASVETRPHAFRNIPPREPRGPVSAGPMESLQEGSWTVIFLESCRGCPVGILGGFAGVHVQGLQAVLTVHRTAPVEFTLTLGHPGDAGRVIASTTAHNFTAVHASGSQVAHTACCTQGACLSVPDTVVWRILKIHKVIFRWFLKPLISHSETSAILVHDNLDGPIVLPPEIITRFSEVGHGQPTCPQST